MRQLNLFSRRRFGALLGAKLTLLTIVGTVQGGTREHHVNIRRFKFEPADLVIKPGDSVIWTNSDPTPHTATAKDQGWDTGRLDKGQSHSRRFNDEGIQDYFCRFHPNMTAKITVLA